MEKRESVSTFSRKGKPSGSEKDLDNQDEIYNEMDEVNGDDIKTDQAEFKHLNRHLHKGEELARFTDREEDDDQP